MYFGFTSMGSKVHRFWVIGWRRSLETTRFDTTLIHMISDFFQINNGHFHVSSLSIFCGLIHVHVEKSWWSETTIRLAYCAIIHFFRKDCFSLMETKKVRSLFRIQTFLYHHELLHIHRYQKLKPYLIQICLIFHWLQAI